MHKNTPCGVGFRIHSNSPFLPWVQYLRSDGGNEYGKLWALGSNSHVTVKYSFIQLIFLPKIANSGLGT